MKHFGIVLLQDKYTFGRVFFDMSNGSFKELRGLFKEIKSRTLRHFYYSSPFPVWVQSNLNGELTPELFFQDLFVMPNKPESLELFEKIMNHISNNVHTSVLLFGARGSGKTTLVHDLQRKYSEIGKSDFEILNFDAKTADPAMCVACEVFGRMLFERFKVDAQSNNRKHINSLYKLYCDYQDIVEQISASAELVSFFEKVNQVYCRDQFDIQRNRKFFKEFKELDFYELLMITVLWDICGYRGGVYKKKTYCLDNIDAMTARSEVRSFWETYFRFTRNIGSAINNLNKEREKTSKGKAIPYVSATYEQAFTFVICVRDTTWAKLSRDERPGDIYPNSHIGVYIDDILFRCDLSYIYPKREILNARDAWLQKHKNEITNIATSSQLFKNIFLDLDKAHRSTIFYLFNNDYRYCVRTLHVVIFESEQFESDISQIIAQDYSLVKEHSLYGARGLIYKGIFDMFDFNNYFVKMGILDLSSTGEVATSTSRLLLTYLSSETSPRDSNLGVPVSTVIREAKQIAPYVSEEEIKKVILGMYNLKNGNWGHLITLALEKESEVLKIDTELPDTAIVQITEAGIEYLDFIATHFEFFSCRIQPPKEKHPPLFARRSLERNGNAFVFEHIIEAVYGAVRKCCERLHNFIENSVLPEYKKIERILETPFVYRAIVRPYEGGERQEPESRKKVFHGERLLHTHITYLDQFRIYAIHTCPAELVKVINEKVVSMIESYIALATDFPNVCSNKEIFEEMRPGIQMIKDSGYIERNIRIR